MIGYASSIGGEVADFPSQVADLTMEAVDTARAFAENGAAVVTPDGEPAVINSHGQAVPVAGGGLAALAARAKALPIWAWGLIGVAGYHAWKKLKR